MSGLQQRVLKRTALFVVLGLCTVNACFGNDASPETEASTSIEKVASGLAADFQDTQAKRLLRIGGRDELIASMLLSFSPGGATASSLDDSEAASRLSKEYAGDELAAYVLALLCHRQQVPCLHPEYRQRLLELDPDNAIHWLVVPNGSELTGEELRRASESRLADSHFSEMLGVLRRSLEGQGPGDPVPATWRGNRELALLLRRNEIGRVPWPDYAQVIAACNVQVALSAEGTPLKRECASLGALLFAEHGNNMASKSVGSTMTRRFARNTAQADAAVRYRRQYVWMSEQAPDARSAEESERLNEEEIALGEWEAYQRSAERSGISREPPPDWVPEQPELLLLQEERKK